VEINKCITAAHKNSRDPKTGSRLFARAATGTRTLDLRFTKASLYQLSYGGKLMAEKAATG
jgi:hypothetical protein